MRPAPGQADAMNVWAYRGRPVYTYAGDEYPGAANGHGIGEFSGTRNGYHAFTLRDDLHELRIPTTMTDATDAYRTHTR